MKTIEIAVHSFVDQITNSSSVIYVVASDTAVTWIKSLISSIIKTVMPDSTKTCDDFYDVFLGVQCPKCKKVFAKNDENVALLNENRGDCPECKAWVEWEANSAYTDDGIQWSVILQSKSDTIDHLDVGSKIRSAFMIDSYYDG